MDADTTPTTTLRTLPEPPPTVLSPEAVDLLAAHGTTAAAWARAIFDTPDWYGDTCGCPDDRCIGHHHEDYQPCGCLRALLTTGATA